MPLADLLFTMLNRRGITLSLELRNYMKIAHPGMEISKPGYLKQRMKLNPLAFYELYRHHNRNFYTESGFSTFQGYLVLAADGSGINIPTTRETLEEFGTSSRKGTKPQASIGLGCLYDVMNRMILESDCCKCKFDEMRLAEEQIDRVCETIGASQPFLVVMDRGYPSTAAFIRMMEKGILFLVRLKSSDYKKEQSALSGPDGWVDIFLDKSRINHYKGTDIGQRMEELGSITLRMVKVPLKEEREEILITNLPSETFDRFQIAELYQMRWGIETAYETLKDRLQIENFTGTKPVLLLQDIYSTIYISNLAEDIIRDAEAELDEKEKHRKHKMMINRTLSIGILKNDLIYILLERDEEKQDRLFHQIYEPFKFFNPIFSAIL
ncbi:IS4 family transposase [Bacteroides acidifaciens]|uniref:IS4 family transposase n=1 Tax=Bacteroides acidifaciens TaxID=85831 RepID=UPI0025A64331|nr:IS4 family transposase [Bacteroides acidifaciens]